MPRRSRPSSPRKTAAHSGQGTHDNASWTPEKEFSVILERELSIIWHAQSDVTRGEASDRAASEFFRVFGQEPLPIGQCSNLAQEIFLTFSTIVLTEAALKIPASRNQERAQYMHTIKAMADILFQLLRTDEVQESDARPDPIVDGSRSCVIQVLTHFAKGFSAGQWEVRYRLLQFVVTFLKKMEEVDAMISFVHGNNRTDHVRRGVLERAFDVKDRVAALSMEAIAHYQYEKQNPETSKAFAVMLKRIEDSGSGFVRTSAIRFIHICTVSAPVVIRRILDESWEVRVATFDVIGDLLAPKILAHQLRAFILLTGLNDEKLQVRSAACKCMEKWLEQCKGDYPGMISDVNVTAKNPLYGNLQFGMDIFDPQKLHVPKKAVPSNQAEVVIDAFPANTSSAL